MKNSILGKARWLRDVALATSKNNGARVAREWLKYAAMFVMLLTLGSGNAWGEETTYKSASEAATNKKNGISLSVTSGSLTSGAYYRIDKGKTLTISSSSGNITSIIFTCTDTKYAKLASHSPAGTYSESGITVTWTGSATSVTFTAQTGSGKNNFRFTQVVITTEGGGDCSECTYYVYNGSTWESIGTTGFDDVVLAPPTLPSNNHGAGNGCWVTDKNIYDGGDCVTYTSGDKYRYVPNPGGDPPDAENKPGSGTCELYAVYLDGGCLSTTVTAVQCARIWEVPDNLAVSSVSSNGATLSWDAIAGVSSYHVIVTKVSNSSIVFDGNVTGTSKSLTSLASGTEYSWKVAANSTTDDACDSNFSNGDNFTTCASGFTSLTPTVTAGNTGKNGGEALFELSGATSYSVTLKNNSTNAVIAGYDNVSNTSGDITFSGLTASTTYRVEVIAHNACGDNSLTGSETFTTDAATLYTVTFYNAAGDAPEAVTQTTEGGTVNIPSAEACDGWTFVGWKIGGAQSSTTSDPTGSGYITSALWPKTDYVPAGNIDVYAVFSKTEGGGGGEPTAYSVGNTGNFVLAAQVGDVWYALPTTPTVNSGKITGVNLTVSETAGGVKYVTSANASGKTWTIANAANGQSISDGTKSGDKPNYLYHANGGSSGTNLAYGTGTTYTWKITSDANGLIFAGQSGSTTNNRGMLFSSTNNNVFGGYALSNKDANGYQRVQILPIAGGGTTTWRSDVSCTCPNYSFHSKNSLSVWEDPICFAQVESSTLYRTEEIALPTDGVSFKVGWHDADDVANAKTSEKDWAYMVAGPTTTRPDGGYWTVGGHLTSGNTGGAKGYFYVYSDSNEDNKYVGFTPSGYVLRWGKGESWTSKAFTAASASIDETEWNTEAVTLSSSNASDHIYVGLKTESGFVWCNNSEEQRVIFLSPGVWNSDGCKFALWDKTHRAWRGFMQDSDGDGIYEGTVPSDCNEVTFARFDGAKKEPVWDQQYNKSADQTISSLADKNMFSVTGWGGTYCEGNWNTVYAKPGVFRINAGSNLKNWSCKFVPHYVLTYDKNDVGASGSMDPTTVASDALSKNVSVAACGFTAPTGYHFDHWDTASDGSGTDYNPNDTYNLTADATLYAIWAPNNHTLIWDFNGGSSSETEGIDYTAGGSVNYGTKIDYPSDASMSKAGYTFTGWSSSPATMPDDNLTITAQWSVQSYTITWNVNGSTYTTGDPSTSAESGTKWSALTLPTAPADNTLSDCDRTKFVGWSTSPLFGDGNDAPADLFKTTSDANADSHTITEATTFYAVFAKGNGDFSFGWESADDASIWTISGFCNKETYSDYKKTGSYAGSIQGTSGYIQLKDKISPTSISCQYTKASSNTNSSSKFIIQTSSNGKDWTDQATGKTMNNVTQGTFYELKWTGSLNDVYVRVYYTGTNAARVLDDVVISGGSFTDYATQCCTLKPVTNLAVSSTTANSVTLTWTAPSPTTGIDHLELRNASTDAKIGNNIAVGTTTTTVDGLTECETYTYKIVSVGAVCETPSNIVEATPFGGSEKVTFDYNGGTGTPASFTTSCGNLSTTLPTPDARDGYTFLGWWTAADGGSKVGDAGANYNVATTTTIHAHWAQNFSITYERVGGTDVCANETCGAGMTYTVCGTEPTKSGYIFAGWKDASTSVVYNAGDNFTMPAADVTLTAQWTANWRNLTFNVPAGGGSITGGPSGNHVLDNRTFTFPNITGKSDAKWCWTFLGWTETAPNGSGTWATTPSYIAGGATSGAITSDKTYYAVYSKTGAGASGDVYLTNEIITAKWADGGNTYGNSTTITAGGEWTYTGYGQKNNTYLQLKDGISSIYLKTPAAAGNITTITINYVAVSSDTRTIYCNTSNSTTGAVTNKFDGTYSSGNHDVEIDVSSLASTSIYIGCDANIKFNSVSFHYGPAAIYGYTLDDCPCVVEEFDLTYDANATNFPGSTTTCTGVTDYRWEDHDNEYTICSTEPTLEGYKFTHWATNANGSGTTYNAGEVISCVGETPITLYAQYERVYTVSFNNQGTITPVTQASAGASVAVPSATSPCNGEWAFVGWSETAIAPMSFLPTLEITAGEGTYTPTADKTLYAIYRKTSESSPFVAGMSGAYKIKATVNATDYYAGAVNGAKLNQETTVGNAVTYYIKYTSADGGKYTIQRADGKYIAYKGNQPTGASTDIKISDDAFYWRISSAGGGLWAIQSPTSTDANTRYLQLSVGTGFKAYTTDVNPTFVAAEGEYYYRTMSCEDEFDITFHNNGTTINWAGGYPEAAYKGLADATVISTFPTATFDGWTFIGWRQADYKESTDAPASSSVFGGSNGTSGNKLTIASANVDLYPVFTRFEDNEPFDQINGGDYYIYFLDKNQTDEYGAYKRVYAASYDGDKRYSSTAVCDNATTFTFTKLDNGNWTIYDKTTKKYLYGVANDALKQQASATGAEWTLTLNGNQFDAFHVGTSYGQITAFGNGTSATFMNYRRTNIGSIASYHRVYLGSCTNRTFTTNPSTTPNIEIHGQVKVTSTAGKSIKSTSVLTVSASNIATANLTVTSNNGAFKFSLTSNGTYSASVNIPVVSNKVGVTPIYVEYTPTETTDGIEEATITVSDGDVTPTEVSTESGDVQGRHVPANFVIAAKWGDKWYALPANCTESTSSTTGVLIEVDNASDPTRATAAPSYTKWGLQTVRPSRKAEYGTRLVFTEQLTTATADDQKTLYNGSTTSIQANAMYKNYMDVAAEKYEWIPTTTDLKDYVLTSATTLSGDASARTVSLSNKGVFGTLLINKSNDGKVRILPADFYEPVEMQVIEWKANSLVVMYGGAGIKATTQVGNNDPSSLQTLVSAKVDHGVYELSTSQALTSSTNMPLTITVKNGSDVTTGTCALIVPAIVTGAQDAPLGLTADEATLTDVVVTDGATLSAVATKYTFKNITVYPGGKLVIGSGKQMGMNSLTLRGGSAWGAATYEHKYPQFVVNNATSGAYSNTSGIINYDYVTTKDQYYSFVLPYASNTKNIKYPLDIYGSAVSASNTGSFEFQYYDGAARAAGGTGWKVLAEPATLVAGTGYTFLGMPKKVDAYDGTDDSHAITRQRYGIHRIPMNVAAATVQAGETNSDPGKATPISVTLASKNNDSGWNLVGNPYLANVSGLSNQDIQVGKLVHTSTVPWDGKWQWDDTNPATGVRYIVLTDDGQTFESQQAITATLKTFKNFFVQIQNGGATSLVIPANTRTDKNLAPARYMADVEQDIQLAVDLVSETRSDKVDLLINDVYTAEFDQDGDFTKMMNATKFNLYGVYPGDNLSFIAVDKTTAAGSIAIGYQVPAAGEYTLQLSDRAYVMTDAIEALYVTDHEVSPEVTTDLLENPYSFTVTKAETNDARFTVSIKLKENQDTPTDIDIINGGGDLDGEKPIKFIYHDKMYILRNGVLYDATGKKVREINK